MDAPNDDDPAPADHEPAATDTDDRAAPRADHDEAHLYVTLPLEALRSEAEAMTDIGVPGRLFGESPPDALLPINLLRARLADESTPLAVRDAAWRYLIGNAVDHRGRWCTYVIGVLALRLTERAHYLIPGGERGHHHDKRSVHQHLAVGLLAELFNVRPDDQRIGDRILWRAVYRAKQAWWKDRDAAWPPIPGLPVLEPEPQVSRYTQPDHALARVLRGLVVATAGVKPSRTDRRPKVNAQDAALIALCTMYGRTIPEAAAEIGMSPAAARSRLPDAKRAVFTLLASPYLQGKHPHWTTNPPTGTAGRRLPTILT